METTSVILFDGVCNVCNATVRFIIPRDPGGRFRFAALQSPAGQGLRRAHGVQVDAIQSMVLIDEGKPYLRSTAALRIVRRLGGLWPMLGWLVVIPAPVRDWAYDLFAAYRYRVFGRSESCLMPTPEVRDRFLDAGVG